MVKKQYSKTEKIDVESRKVEKEEENIFTRNTFKTWFPLGITLFILLICLAITLCLVDLTPHYPKPVAEKILESKTLKWRFPEANFTLCCSTMIDKQNYLKKCNEIFKKEKIECFDVTEGSIIVELKSYRIDFQEGILNGLSGIEYINGFSTNNHHKYEIQSEPEKVPVVPENEEDNNNNIFPAALHAPTWFANLNEEDKTNIVALLSQGIEQYGRFSQDVKQDLLTKFQIKDFQAEELYKFLYHSQNNEVQDNIHIGEDFEQENNQVPVQDNIGEDVEQQNAFELLISFLAEYVDFDETVERENNQVPVQDNIGEAVEQHIEEDNNNNIFPAEIVDAPKVIDSDRIHYVQSYTINYKAQKNIKTERQYKSPKPLRYETIEAQHTERVLNEINNDAMEHLSKNSFLLESKQHILELIVNKFLVCKDILVLQKTCKFFQNLLQPNHDYMITFYDFGLHDMVHTTVSWKDIQYFLKQSCYNGFNGMEMFNIKDNYYAILTPENKCFVWQNNVVPYTDILHHQFEDKQNSYKNQTKSSKIYDKRDSTYVTIKIGEENDIITTSLTKTKFELRKIKMVISTNDSFAVLYDNNRLCFLLDDFETQLNVKMVVSTLGAFAALLQNGRVLTWGNGNNGSEILDNIQCYLANVKMIFSTENAFVALLEDESVMTWQENVIPDNIQTQLQNVKTISSNRKAFAALLNDGSVVAWGNNGYGGNIPIETQNKLKNVKLIISTDTEFAALLDNGDVFVWGGNIPNDIQIKIKDIKIIFSTKNLFAALSKVGNTLFWWNNSHDTPRQIKNVRTVIPQETQFRVIHTDGTIPPITML